MRIPTFTFLFDKAYKTFIRFPIAIIFTFIIAIIFFRLVHIESSSDDITRPLMDMVMSSYIGMLAFISIQLISRHYSTAIRIALFLATLAAVVIHYYSLYDQPNAAWHYYHFIQIVIALHLLVSFLPFINGKNINGFWQYNRILFIRFLTGGLYTAVLYGGLALALLAIDKLFKADINDKTYIDLLICMGVIFQTFFFLSGIPEDFSQLEEQYDYPKGLNVFTRYILFPLILIYLFILYAYTLKIIFSASWPVGWVAYLVLFYSLFGILWMLLDWPRRANEEGKILRLVHRSFFIAMIPLIIMLFVAILKRINAYGFTVERYFVFILACWLAIVALYFIFSRIKNIKLIPISLCLIALATSFGPQGAEAVSRKSQLRILQAELNNKKVKETSSDDNAESSAESVFYYLYRTHGYRSVGPLVKVDLDSLNQYFKSIDHIYFMDDSVKQILGIQNAIKQDFNFNLHIPHKQLLSTTDWDYVSDEISFYSNNQKIMT